MQLLIILAAVLTSSLVAATAQNVSGQCVSQQEFDDLKKQLAASQQEFDTMKEQLGRSRQETAAVKREVDSWQNSTILILKQYLIENPKDVRTELQHIKDELTQVKQDMREECITTRNTSQKESTALQQQLLQYMQSLEHRILEQNSTLQEMTSRLPQNTVQHFPNGTFQNPASSCKYIEQGSPSGYYWIQKSAGGYASQVYCNMTRQCCGSTGGWMRVTDLDMTNPAHLCPQGFRTVTSPKRLCGRQSGPGCVSTTFPVHGIQYQKVCGRTIGYQYYSIDAFAPYHFNRHITIDGTYIDGVSITHGHNPRKHIWSFAAAADETGANQARCPCTKIDAVYTGAIPPFVGQDYFCDTGSRYNHQDRIYTHDPLWDGHGCGPRSTCCSFNSPPWFCKQLPRPTIDDIELRLCSDQITSNEDALIELVELYVQ